MQKFNEAVSSFSKPLQDAFSALDDKVKSGTYEIRLRLNRPVMLYGAYGNGFIDSRLQLTHTYSPECRICSPDELHESFNRICGYSIHAHQSSINDGYITMRGGHRAGVVGTAVCDREGKIVSVKDVSSLNIRIARPVKHCADEIADTVFSGGAKSLIIAGPPASGKTTILRDLIRILAGGDGRYNYKIAVVDEREELACSYAGTVCNDIGINCDVFNSYPKKDAVVLAVKTMSPQIIALDEVGTQDEVNSIELAVNSGVRFIVTVHASSFDEIVTRPLIERLINTYSFDKVCLLSSGAVCKTEAIFDSGEIRDEILRRRCNSGFYGLCEHDSQL